MSFRTALSTIFGASKSHFAGKTNGRARSFKRNNPGCGCACFGCCVLCGEGDDLAGGSNTPKTWTANIAGVSYDLAIRNTLLDGITAVSFYDNCGWGKVLPAPVTIGSCDIHGFLLTFEPAPTPGAGSGYIRLVGVDSDLTTALITWRRDQQNNGGFTQTDCSRPHKLPYLSGCSTSGQAVIIPRTHSTACYTYERNTVSAPCSLTSPAARLQEAYTVYFDPVITDGVATDCEPLNGDYKLFRASAGVYEVVGGGAGCTYGGNVEIVRLRFTCPGGSVVRLAVSMDSIAGSPTFANWRLDVPFADFVGAGPFVLPFFNEPHATNCTVTGSTCYVIPASNP